MFNYLFYLNFSCLHPFQTFDLHGFDEEYKWFPELVLYLENLGPQREKIGKSAIFHYLKNKLASNGAITFFSIQSAGQHWLNWIRNCSAVDFVLIDESFSINTSSV